MLKHTEQMAIVLETLPDNAAKISISFEDTTDDERGVLHWYAVTYEVGLVLTWRVEQVITVNQACGTVKTPSHYQTQLFECSVCGTSTPSPDRLANGDPICDVCLQDHIEYTGPTRQEGYTS